jgi:hypothetical protein
MKAGKIAAAVIAAGALAVPASASAASAIYAGTTDGDGQIAMTVTIKQGIPKRITEIRGVSIPVNCEISGPQRANTRIPTDIRVTRSRGAFAFSNEDSFGNESAILGKFRGRTRRNAAGSLVYANHFAAEGSLPEENCSTDVLDFHIRKGAPDVVFPTPLPRRG